MNTSPLALINLRLHTIPSRGDPFNSVANAIAGYFVHDSEDDLVTVDLSINIDPEQPKSLETHWKHLAVLIKQLEK